MLKSDKAMEQRSIHHSKTARWILLGIVLIFFTMLLWGIQRDLPYAPDFDEPNYVTRAVKMASSGNWNPERFAHPASTTYYPLTVIYHVWHAATHHGMFFHADPNLQILFNTSFWEFYILGRFLSVIYAVLSIPLIYLLGKEVFGVETGVIGALFFSFYSLVILYSRMVRTDSAALFFGLLSLWLLTRIYRKPTTFNQLLAGLSIGLSIASRYFMVMLVPVLVVIDGAIWRRQKPGKASLKLLWMHILIGLGAVAVGFILSTPYFFVSLDILIKDILLESRDTHLGFDGLSPTGNFFWYITYAIPTVLSLPQGILMVVGVGFSLWKRHFLQMWLFGFALIFLMFISRFSLHWPRWLIQILPVLALFSAYGVIQITQSLSKILPLAWSGKKLYKTLLLVSVLFLLFTPVKKVTTLNLKAANYSTRILAREWMLENLPMDSHIAIEEYTAPLGDAGFVVFNSWALAQSGYTLDKLYQDGYRYVVVSEAIYGRFFAEFDRYPAETTFYQTLFDEGELIQKIEPSSARGGRTIQIYKLDKP